jgi:hypothetical protein
MLRQTRQRETIDGFRRKASTGSTPDLVANLLQAAKIINRR